jgi:chromosomal replication initiator protein
MHDPVDTRNCKHAVRLALAKGTSAQDLCRWFDPLRMEHDAPERRIVVTWPHRLFAGWVDKTSLRRLEAAVRSLYGEDWSLIYTFPEYRPEHHNDPSGERPDTRTGVARSFPLPKKSGAEDDKNNQNFHPFGQEYRLDTFLVNAKNTFTHTVLKKTAAGEWTSNPLVLHGNPGTGKTHLIRAVANALSAGRGSDALFCGSVDDFSALATTQDKRRLYRRLFLFDAFLLDDLHKLPMHEHLTAILPDIIDHCLNARKIFMAATCLAPAQWGTLPGQISTRLEQGLVMPLHEADMDIRLRYAQRQNLVLELHLDKNQLFILTRECSGLRRLNGVMQRLHAMKHLLGEDLSLQNINRALAHTVSSASLNPQQIIRLVAAYCNVRQEDLLSLKRQSRIARARQLAMFMCRSLAGLSYPAIGRLFGGRDHSTVIHSVKKIQVLSDIDKDMHKCVAELSASCRGRDK